MHRNKIIFLDGKDYKTSDKSVCGVYMIQNEINGKKYVGSSKHIRKRWRTHLASFQEHTSQGPVNPFLEKDVAAHGIKSFSCHVLEECIEQNLSERENYWIKKHNTLDENSGYNRGWASTRRGWRGDCRGEKNPNAKFTKEVVEEIRDLYKKKGTKHGGALTYKNIAKMYDVSRQCIEKICLNKRWAFFDQGAR